MKIQNFAHDQVACLRLLPENEEDLRSLAVAHENIARFSVAYSTFVTLQGHPGRSLSILFTKPIKDETNAAHRG